MAIIIIFVLRFNTQTRNVLSKFLSPFWDAPVVKEDPEQLQKIIDMQQKKLVDSARGSHSMGSLRAENKVLRELLEAPVPYGYNAVFAHVISHDPASGNRRLVIDKGK
ncbi:MAG: hypothetical protein HRT89_06725, partial [Lentisphaeria bacterium]|nr:hypothetical protein [Lentisphaeria bacterium]NQZ67748.1 hypothetical protein [Lentisphaeria bacterium]